MFRKTRTQTVLDQAGELAEDLAARIQPHLESAREHLDDLIDDAKDKAAPVVSDARDKAAAAVHDARERAAAAAEDARKSAAEAAEDARGRAGVAATAAAHGARERATEAADEARSRFKKEVVPAVSAAAATAAAKSEPIRAEAKRRGLATSAALKGELDPPKKGGKLKKLLLVGGVVGLGALVLKKLTEDKSGGWQESYTPAPPPPAPAPAPAKVAGDPLSDASFGDKAAGANKPPAPGADDASGSSPDEAAADAVDAPHEVTTPDAPAEKVEVDPVDDPKS